MIKVLINENLICQKIGKIAKDIFSTFGNKEFTIISLLNGSFIFLADFVRELSQYTTNFKIVFIRTKSYSGVQSTGRINFFDDLSNIKGKNILIVDDILDTGLTVAEVVKKIKNNNPNLLKVLFFLVKEVKREHNVQCDFYCFKIPDKFVVGYGLDFDEKYRGLPFVGFLEEE